MNLQKIVEFLNNGQTNVDKNDIEKFIEAAKFLQIIGIENNLDNDFVDNEDNNPDASPVSENETTKGVVMEENQCLNVNTISNGVHSKDLLDLKLDLDFDTKTEMGNNLVINDDRDEQDTNPLLIGNQRSVSDAVHSKDVNDEKPFAVFDIKKELDNKAQELLEKIDGLWECKLCGKTFVKKDHATSHTETHNPLP